MKLFWLYVLRFFLPWACSSCRAGLETLYDSGFCPKCWLSIPRIQGTICYFCGIPLRNGGRCCFSCRDRMPGLLIRAAAEYRSSVRKAIYRFKYAGRPTLCSSMGNLLSWAWDRYPELHAVDALISIPMHQTNQRLRGYNQSELLAQQLSLYVQKPLFKGILERSIATRSQYKLNRNERRLNLAGAFSITPRSLRHKDLLNKSLLLVDDICTTTATLSECAKVLRRAGARSVKALVLARDL